MPTVAVCHAAPDPYLPFLAETIPADRLRVCRTPEAIADGARDAEVVLAFKFGGRPFPRETILALPALRWDFDRLRAQQAEGRWQCHDVPTLRGLTMGVVGAGHVGGRIARLARAAGMRTLGVRRSPVGAAALAGAILDVFASEPLPPDDPFWRDPRVFVTPHISSEFTGWTTAVARLFLANLSRWTRGEALISRIDPARGY